MKRMLMLCAVLSVPAYVYGVDGQILINQSTVNAAGGFPYQITQPGSYKLSGNLMMNTSVLGNFNGMDVAISIGSNNVTLDLNGFTILVNDLIGGTIGHSFYAIAESGAFSQISIVNGSVRVSSPTTSPLARLGAINFPTSWMLRFDELTVVGVGGAGQLFLSAGPNSLVHHVIANGYIVLTCPATAIDNVALVEGGTSIPGEGCLIVNQPHAILGGIP